MNSTFYHGKLFIMLLLDSLIVSLSRATETNEVLEEIAANQKANSENSQASIEGLRAAVNNLDNNNKQAQVRRPPEKYNFY